MKNSTLKAKGIQSRCIILEIDPDWRIKEGVDIVRTLLGLKDIEENAKLSAVIKEPSLSILKTNLPKGIPVCALSLKIRGATDQCETEFLLGAMPKQGPNGEFRGAVLMLKEVTAGNMPPELILDNVADGVFSVDKEWRITSFNPSAERITGWKKDEVLGRFCSEVFRSNVCGGDCILSESVRSGRQIVDKHIFMTKKDGQKVPISVSAAPVLDCKGDIVGGVETFRDITLELERDLILNSITDGVFTIDRSGRITSFNKAAERITGFSAQEAIGRKCHEIFQSSLCGVQCALTKSMETGKPYVRSPVFIRHKKGHIVPIRIATSPLLDHEGNIFGGVETFQDQTLKFQRDIIVDSIADGVFTVDKDWRITSFNKAAERITGHKAKDAIGKKCHEIFRSSICGPDCILAQSIGQRTPISNRTITIERANGTTIPVSISASPLLDADGNLIGGVETFRDLRAITALRKRITKQYTFADIISKSPKMQKIFEILPDIAKSDSNVLILGESGTGKELIARAIHNLSPRKRGPFVAVNCGALPDTLLESELFGYKKGAFTDAKQDKKGRFAAAEKGTIFLDEIGDISQALQVKLLRVLQDKTYEPLGSNKPVKADVRVLAATNKDLAVLVNEGKFREDLYYRLNVVKIVLPPLRERLEDIPLLVDHFIKKLNVEKGKEIKGISDSALTLLMRYDYPGNVRELENIIEYAFILCHGEYIEPQHLPEPFVGGESKISGVSAFAMGPKTLEEIEKEAILAALERNRWRKMATCKELGISKDTLRRKIERYGLEKR